MSALQRTGELLELRLGLSVHVGASSKKTSKANDDTEQRGWSNVALPPAAVDIVALSQKIRKRLRYGQGRVEDYEDFT
jgi:hypothetical protein